MAVDHLTDKREFPLRMVGVITAIAIVLLTLAMAYLVVPPGSWNAMMGWML